jgi:hypothetical protein
MSPGSIEERLGRGRRAERAPVDRRSFGMWRRGASLASQGLVSVSRSLQSGLLMTLVSRFTPPDCGSG